MASKPLLPWLITVTMFAIGCMLPRDEVRQVLRRWPLVLNGTAVQYLGMPTLAYWFAHAWGLSGGLSQRCLAAAPGADAARPDAGDRHAERRSWRDPNEPAVHQWLGPRAP